MQPDAVSTEILSNLREVAVKVMAVCKNLGDITSIYSHPSVHYTNLYLNRDFYIAFHDYMKKRIPGSNFKSSFLQILEVLKSMVIAVYS